MELFARLALLVPQGSRDRHVSPRFGHHPRASRDRGERLYLFVIAAAGDDGLTVFRDCCRMAAATAAMCSSDTHATGLENISPIPPPSSRGRPACTSSWPPEISGGLTELALRHRPERLDGHRTRRGLPCDGTGADGHSCDGQRRSRSSRGAWGDDHHHLRHGQDLRWRWRRARHRSC